MEKFDQPIWYNILLNSSLNDVLKQCQINKRIASVCKSNQFWDDYLLKQWKITFKGKDSREVVIKAERLLLIMKAEEQIMTLDCFWSIIEFFPENQFRNLFEGFKGVVDFPTLSSKLTNFNLPEFYGFDISSIPLHRNNNTSIVEKEFIGQMLTLVNEPTNYILDRNKVTRYDYDVDFDILLLYLLTDVNPVLYEYWIISTEHIAEKLYRDLYPGED